MCYYLKKGQIFEDVIRQDAEVLRKAGVTHQQVGDALEKVFKSFNWHSGEGNQRVNDTLSIDAVAYKGFEICPYDRSLTASTDFFVSGIPNGSKAGKSAGNETAATDFFVSGIPNRCKIGKSTGNETTVTGMMPDLIRKLHFFEGDVPYGIRPEWAIQVYEIVEREGANIWVPQTKTVYATGSSSRGITEDILSKNFCGSLELKATADRVIELAPGVTIYMKGDKGIIFAEKEFRIPSDLQIDGLSIHSFDNRIYRGQTFIDKCDKIIG